MKNTKEEFIKEFCNDHNERVRWLRGVASDEECLLERILEWFDGKRSSTTASEETRPTGEKELLKELMDIINWQSYVTVDVFEDKKSLSEQETEAGELIEKRATAFIEKLVSQVRKEERNKIFTKEEWSADAIRRELKRIVYEYDQEKAGGKGKAYVDMVIVDKFTDFILQLLSERTFTKEELRFIDTLLPEEGTIKEYKISRGISRKISKLLKEENGN